MKIATRFPDLDALEGAGQVPGRAAPSRPTPAATSSSSRKAGTRTPILVARAPNPFASVCGRVCAAPCEDACRRGSIDAPISIRALKRFVTEQYGVESIRPDTQDRLRGELVSRGEPLRGAPARPSGRGARPAQGGVPKRKVAVIGAGPAGLSAAHDLALLGYAVTVFEAADEPGGMMRFGIPEYRLPRTLIRAEIDRILALGVDAPARHARSTPAFGLTELRARGLRGRLPLGRRFEAARPRRSRASSSTAS